MRKHSVRIAGHATSFSLEDEFWESLKEIAARRDVSMNRLVTEIDAGRGEVNLSSALRLCVLQDLKTRLLSD